jgi:dihydrofolate synthase/folylpolyglutamate synthase
MTYKSIYYPVGGIGTTYPQCLRWLYAINDKLKADGISAPSDASLTNTRRLYDLIGRPLDRIPTVHVGGTNGKGRTSYKVSEALRASGLRTGLFVSPHLASYRERMQVDAQLITEEQFVQHLPTVLHLCAEHSVPATLFEITFVLACLYYEASACQVVVLEVGLGGELDATNVVNTALSVVCSVSLDHVRILGATVEEIGAKKAGIFKSGVPALVGPSCPLEVMAAVARDRGAPLLTLQQATDKYGPWAAAPSSSSSSYVASSTPQGTAEEEDTDVLNGRLSYAALCILRETQLAQDRAAFAAVDVASDGVTRALLARPPCRWEHHTVPVDVPGAAAPVPVTVVLDVGHNPAAVAALCARVRREFPARHVRMLYAVSRDKDVRTCLKQVLGAVQPSHIHFAQSSNFRAVSQEELGRIFREELGHEYTHHIAAESVRDLVAKVIALAAADGGDSVVVVCGTGYIMPDARAQLGIVEPRYSGALLHLTHHCFTL